MTANVLQHYFRPHHSVDIHDDQYSFDDDANQTEMVDRWDGNSDYAPTPGNFARTPATVYSPSPAPECATDQLRPDSLDFLPLREYVCLQLAEC